MRKNIKVSDIKEKIEYLLHISVIFKKIGDEERFDICYNRALTYKILLFDLCLDAVQPFDSYIKESDDIDKWFNDIIEKVMAE